MFVFASGDFGTELSTDNGTPGNGIEIKKAQYQGGLFAANKIDATVTDTVVQGPMVSAYGDVATGQGGELSFPSISFPTSGSSGFTGPLHCQDFSPPATSVAADMRPERSNPGQRARRKESHGAEPSPACRRRPRRERRPSQGRPAAGRPLRRRARAATGLLRRSARPSWRTS